MLRAAFLCTRTPPDAAEQRRSQKKPLPMSPRTPGRRGEWPGGLGPPQTQPSPSLNCARSRPAAGARQVAAVALDMCNRRASPVLATATPPQRRCLLLNLLLLLLLLLLTAMGRRLLPMDRCTIRKASHASRSRSVLRPAAPPLQRKRPCLPGRSAPTRPAAAAPAARASRESRCGVAGPPPSPTAR